ncbi:DUF421 domain-containing protein [Microvirga pudoricolor]|uniref:DUF421 domain-containing protein n=1 Tax=Microvirga pudoricolor TaxID=2778729 RepID=UPI0019506DBB|nr:YetF domain-containing protein [Microvirga pudoricolor]MBM6596388.1 DUF421 domain-containing protein [Microvirga pudoricolor]
MAVDWPAMFVPEHAIAEIVLRGTIMYFVLFSILRFALKRQSGTIGISDLLVIVLIADAAQNAMANEYKSITEGALLVFTIVFWNVALNWLGYHIPLVQRFLRPAPLPLVEDGRPIRRHLRQEMITMDELASLLREQGVEDIAEVKRAFMEGDGRISVIRQDGESCDARGTDRTVT